MVEYSKKLEYVRRICRLTGENGTLNTEQAGVLGTDLGIPFEDGNDLYLLFGDTFSEFWQKGRWINNCMVKVKDFDGKSLTSDGFIAEADGTAKELITGKKIDKEQMTCIPTGAVAINGIFYMFVMSVVTWEPRWTVDSCSLYRSDDRGHTWKKSESVCFTKEEAPDFGQVFLLEDGDFVYLFGIPEARDGDCKLARVSKEKIDNFEKYEYYIGKRGGSPCFSVGKRGLSEIRNNRDSVVIEKPCGEMSVMYNEYLKKYLAVYLGTDTPDIVFRTSEHLWGPWSNREIVALQKDYVGLYGGFVHKKLTRENGKSVFFMMSEWQPYNVSLFEMKFK